MTMTSTPRLTADEFLAGDFPRGTQLINGEIVMTNARFWHQELCKRLLFALESWIRAGTARGIVGFGGNWMLDEHSIYKPDVWWLATERVPRGDPLYHELPPDIAVEVRSPGTWVYDVGTKRGVYEQTGTEELWLVDTAARVVLVYARSRQGGAPRFDVEVELGLSHALVSPLLPGFKLGVDELFAGAP